MAQAATTVIDSSFGTDTVIVDQDNGQEFLQLELTSGYGYAGIEAELGVGGDFEGWTIATESQMDALGVSYGLVAGSSDPSQIALMGDLQDFFCPTAACINGSSTHIYVRGLVDGETQNSPSKDAYSFDIYTTPDPDEVDFRISGYDYMGSGEYVYLTRIAAVPLPAGVLLLLTGLAGLGAMRKRRRSV